MSISVRNIINIDNIDMEATPDRNQSAMNRFSYVAQLSP